MPFRGCRQSREDFRPPLHKRLKVSISASETRPWRRLTQISDRCNNGSCPLLAGVGSSVIVVKVVVGEFVAAAFVSLFSVYDALSTNEGRLFGF